MGIKDKLVQILGWYEADKAVADEIVAQLRCENCRHWYQQLSPSGRVLGRCRNFSSPCCDPGTTVSPDFFCALFEAK